MTVPTIFKTCSPRADILEGKVAEADFAADLAKVISGSGPDDYVDPERFFANTYPTRGLRNLLTNVCSRLSGAGGEAASVFRLDTSFGGGKTHGLIALCHAARSGADIPKISEFIDPALLPKGRVRIAAFDGENADPANGRRMDTGQLAFTPWGEIAAALGGTAGYERLRESDMNRQAPGAGTIQELFGDEPTLILLDELSVYLRKVQNLGNSANQLTPFLTSLIKAVEGAPNAALVYTLAIGKDGLATDAYQEENHAIADGMAEAEKVSARKATLLNPTEEDETVQVLRRWLFESIDEAAADAAAAAYRDLWKTHAETLPDAAGRPEAAEAFRSSYPLHPAVLQTLTSKTATLGNFQRVRGMLRLLARTTAHMWKERPADATAIHLHHIDTGHGPIKQEIVTRLEQSEFVPALSNDVSSGPGSKPALAQDIDAEHYSGMPPYASYVARTIFLHTLAFNEQLKGLSKEDLLYSMLGPKTDISFAEDARKKFLSESAYLDDRPGAPMRFMTDANLMQILRRTEDQVDAQQARAELNDRIREIFSGGTLDTVPFPAGPYDVADEPAGAKPQLVVLGFEAVSVGASVESVPVLIKSIFEKKGADGTALRSLRNNLVFVAAEEARKDDMRKMIRRRLALLEMTESERLSELADYQKKKLQEMEMKSRTDVALAIQNCYRHVFYPSRNSVGSGNTALAHTALDTYSTSEKPGSGQTQIVRALRELNELRVPSDEPNSPAWVRDQTPLKKGRISTSALRGEFRRDPAMPILIGDDVFRRGVRLGIERGLYVYQSGDLLQGPGDPEAEIKIDEKSTIFTIECAKSQGIWPRPAKPEPQTPEPPEGPCPKPGPVGPEPGPEPPPPDSDVFSAEGILREALVSLWEQARAKKAEAIASLTIRMFEAEDAFKLLVAVGAVSGAGKVVTMEGGYETRDGGSLEIEFRGPVSDAQPVREFLQPQLRDADSKGITSKFELTFEDGLSMEGKGADALTEQLSRFSNGAAHVTASRKAKT